MILVDLQTAFVTLKHEIPCIKNCIAHIGLTT